VRELLGRYLAWGIAKTDNMQRGRRERERDNRKKHLQIDAAGKGKGGKTTTQEKIAKRDEAEMVRAPKKGGVLDCLRERGEKKAARENQRTKGIIFRNSLGKQNILVAGERKSEGKVYTTSLRSKTCFWDPPGRKEESTPMASPNKRGKARNGDEDGNR